MIEISITFTASKDFGEAVAGSESRKLRHSKNYSKNYNY
jgi:hypothetical protein